MAKDDESPAWHVAVMVAAVPIYFIGMLGGLLFIPLRGGWREALQLYGDDADKAKHAPE